MSLLQDFDPTLLGLGDGDPFPAGPPLAGFIQSNGTGITYVDDPGVIRVINSGNNEVMPWTGATNQPDWTIHAVLTQHAAGPASAPGVVLPGGNDALIADPVNGGWVNTIDSLPAPEETTVYTWTSTGDFYLNGELVGDAPTDALDQLVFMAIAPGLIFDIHRIQIWDEIPATLQTDMDLLVAEYVGGDPQPVDLAPAQTSVDYQAAATALTTYTVGGEDDPWITPEPPVVDPGGDVTPPPDPAPTPPPPGAPEIMRVSEIMPAPTLDADGLPINWEPTQTIVEGIGRPQIIVEGNDVTYINDAPTRLSHWTRAEPFGSQSATLEFPTITAFHSLGTGAYAWCKTGANVHIKFGDVHLFTGIISGITSSEPDGQLVVSCIGIMWAADLKLKKPPFETKPQDVGQYVAKLLNGLPDRRYKTVPPVNTGLRTSVLGGWNPVLAEVQDALATALTNSGQLTVKCVHDQPVIEAKNTSTVHWSFRHGQRGIRVDLTADLTQGFNSIYGEWVDEQGGRGRNAKYPNWRPDDTPPYPGSGGGIYVGWTDAMTSPTGGVSLWQGKARRPVTGIFSNADRAALVQMQRAAGIVDNGYLGPQSWAMTWQTGSNTGALDGAWIAPLAALPQVEPRLYGPDGDDLGPNPAFDPAVVANETYINFGPGVSKTTALSWAAQYLRREADPGWSGTITFEIDPNEGSRFLKVLEGTNGLIRGYRGQDLLVHVAAVESDGEVVTATVDTRARDYPTLAAQLQREREAVDPARSFRRRQSAARNVSDRATWDAESPCGIVPRHATYANLWNVLRIPFEQYGSIVRTEAFADKSRFAMAVFAEPITHSQLMSITGNPLTAGDNPWAKHAVALEKFGLLQAWGWSKQPCGYWPESYSTPDGEAQAPVTGRMLDDASWTFAATHSPWLWVAIITASNSQFSARFYGGVE